MTTGAPSFVGDGRETIPGRRDTPKIGTFVSIAAGLGVAGASMQAGSAATASFVVAASLAMLWAGTGLILAVRTRNPVSSIVLSVAVVSAVGLLGWTGDQNRDFADTGWLVADAGQRLALALLPALAFHLFLTLPDGRPSRSVHRRYILCGYGLGAAAGLALLGDRSHIVVWPIMILWLGVGLAVPVAHAGYRAASAMDQRRLQWIGWSVLVAAEVSMVSFALSLIANWPHYSAEIALSMSGLIPLALIAGSVPRLVPRVDRILTHTVSVTGLTALIVAAYLLAIAAFGRRPSGSERTLLLLSMVAAAIVAFANQPTQAWLGERANRIIYGERVSPDEALRTWGSRLTRAIPLDELLLQLAEALRKSMQLASVRIWVGADGRYETAAMVPHRPSEPYVLGAKELAVVSRSGVSGGTWLDVWLPGLVDVTSSATTRVAPIAHSGALLGLIVCSRPTDGTTFDEDDDRVLAELARQVGLALHNVQLDTALQASLDELRLTNEELSASRIRIVAAGDSERRKLERNLHDGAQQHLVSIAVKLRLAKDAVVDDPADAEAMIDEVRVDLQEAIAELRALAHGIFPPLLMSGGLGEALPAAATRAALPTTHDISVSRHPAEVEAATYFCCLEAMQNAGKYAGPTASAMLRVWDDPSGLSWEVADDGAGFDAANTASDGQGFLNMRDRMGAFGGTVEVISSPGTGTVVRGRIPIA